VHPIDHITKMPHLNLSMTIYVDVPSFLRWIRMDDPNHHTNVTVPHSKFDSLRYSLRSKPHHGAWYVIHSRPSWTLHHYLTMNNPDEKMRWCCMTMMMMMRRRRRRRRKRRRRRRSIGSDQAENENNIDESQRHQQTQAVWHSEK
jgi:hypothetical protein